MHNVKLPFQHIAKGKKNMNGNTSKKIRKRLWCFLIYNFLFVIPYLNIYPIEKPNTLVLYLLSPGSLFSKLLKPGV